MKLIKDIIKEDFSVEDLKDIEQLSQLALTYLQNQKWCKKVEKQFYCATWNDLFGIFYFEFVPSDQNVDKNVWIVVGDIPSAYIDIESAQNECEVIESYLYIMDNWIESVETGGNMDECFPVGVPPIKKFSDMLKSRLSIIREDILPDCGNQ